MTQNWIIIFIYLCILYVYSSGQKTAKCFQFTWLGPRWNNESIFLNATCEDATKLASGIPCVHPLVVTPDGTQPDVDYIWTNHSEASCVLTSNDVCATYTYYFNGHAENSTHMCTRAVDESGAALTSGCYQHTNGSFSTRVCLCRSIPGGRPCNNGGRVISDFAVIVLAFLFALDRG